VAFLDLASILQEKNFTVFSCRMNEKTSPRFVSIQNVTIFFERKSFEHKVIFSTKAASRQNLENGVSNFDFEVKQALKIYRMIAHGVRKIATDSKSL